jgi:hypothetical protein
MFRDSSHHGVPSFVRSIVRIAKALAWSARIGVQTCASKRSSTTGVRIVAINDVSSRA